MLARSSDTFCAAKAGSKQRNSARSPLALFVFGGAQGKRSSKIAILTLRQHLKQSQRRIQRTQSQLVQSSASVGSFSPPGSALWLVIDRGWIAVLSSLIVRLVATFVPCQAKKLLHCTGLRRRQSDVQASRLRCLKSYSRSPVKRSPILRWGIIHAKTSA